MCTPEWCAVRMAWIATIAGPDPYSRGGALTTSSLVRGDAMAAITTACSPPAAARNALRAMRNSDLEPPKVLMYPLYRISRMPITDKSALLTLLPRPTV